MNIYSVLEDAAQKSAAYPALIDGDRQLSCRDLHAATSALAEEFHAAGLMPGDKLAVLFPNSSDFILAVFAALKLKALVVPVPAALAAAEVMNLARHLAVDAFCYAEKLQSLVPEVRDSRTLAAMPAARLAMIRIGETPVDEREGLLRLDAAFLRFSSGTTAAAKGIVISHLTLYNRFVAQRGDFPLSEHQKILWLQPLSMAFAGHIYVFLSMGSCIVLAGSTDTAQIAMVLRRHSVAQIYAMPLSYRAILNDDSVTSSDFRAVRHIISTSIALADSTSEAFRRRFGREIVQYYGSAESARSATNWNEDIAKRGSIGRPSAGFEFRLEGASPDSGAAESVGELLIRGPGLFDAYYKPWRLRGEVLEDGWFRTGDIARRDAEGYYWIVGRTKEVINVAGVKVFPRELEDILLGHPAVEEALVYGAPEPRFGEVPRAKVKLRPGAAATEKDILDFANAKLSVFRMIRGVEFVNEISKTATGKVRRWAPQVES